MRWASYVAALGLAFTNDSVMPEAYSKGAFFGNRGSWNRNALTDGRPSRQGSGRGDRFLNGEEARAVRSALPSTGQARC